MKAKVWITKISFLILFLSFAVSSQANVITVTSSNDDLGSGNGCTFRGALASANDDGNGFDPDCESGSGDDEIRFAESVDLICLSGGSISVDSELSIIGNRDNPVVLDGAHSTNGDCMGGNTDFQILTVNQSTTLEGLVFRNSDSGILFNNASLATLESVDVELNSGYGLVLIQSTVIASNSNIKSNINTGILIDGSSLIALANSFVGFNTGGGLEIPRLGRAIIVNSTIASNANATQGAGILNSGTVEMSHSTVALNSSLDGAGIFNLGTFKIRNTILADNFASSFNNDCSGSDLESYGYNLVSDTTGCVLNAIENSGTDLLNVASGLTLLGSHGGRTQTFMLESTSPAINNGTVVGFYTDNVATDQRGSSRIGVADIGAIEVGCGDGYVNSFEGESCDDGNTVSSDGCSQTCEEEKIWYRDEDGDGIGNTELSLHAISQPEGYVGASDDCDDSSALKFPDNPEICDGLDNDCDYEIDNGFDVTQFHVDNDNDGDGHPEETVAGCVAPPMTVASGTDCNDADNQVSGLHNESCNDSIDNDCDGQIDENCTVATEDDSDDNSSATSGRGNSNSGNQSSGNSSGDLDSTNDATQTTNELNASGGGCQFTSPQESSFNAGVLLLVGLFVILGRKRAQIGA